jgi:hypothetical protein
MSQARQQSIDEILKNDPWYTADTRLSLEQFPHLTPLADTTFEDHRFAQLDHGRSNELKKFVVDQLEQGQPDSVVHVSGSEFKVSRKDGTWHARGRVEGQIHRLTGNTREEVLAKLVAVAKSPRAFRALTEAEQLEVIRICQSGDRATAICVYLSHVVGEARASRYTDPLDMMNDPALLPAMNECAIFCWYHTHPHAIDTTEWHEFRDRTLAGRPVTFDLLDAIWLRYQDHLYLDNENRSAQPESAQTAPDPQELNDLDDAEVDQLMASTKRQYAREVRAGRR